MKIRVVSGRPNPAVRAAPFRGPSRSASPSAIIATFAAANGGRFASRTRVADNAFVTAKRPLRRAAAGFDRPVAAIALCVSVALHVVVGAALASFSSVHRLPEEPRVVQAQLLAPPAPPPKEATQPPRPFPVARRTRATNVLPTPSVLATEAAETTDSAAQHQPSPVEPVPVPAAAAARAEPRPVASAAPPETSASEQKSQANYLDNPPPPYPAVSRQLREQGRVVLRVLVDERGSPREIEIHRSSGYRRLDEAASRAVRYWRFVPAREGTVPVAAWVQVPVIFSLKE